MKGKVNNVELPKKRYFYSIYVKALDLLFTKLDDRVMKNGISLTEVKGLEELNLKKIEKN